MSPHWISHCITKRPADCVYRTIYYKQYKIVPFAFKQSLNVSRMQEYASFKNLRETIRSIIFTNYLSKYSTVSNKAFANLQMCIIHV